MLYVPLNIPETQIIRKICDIQIESFDRLLYDDAEIDVDLRAMGMGVKRADIDNDFKEQIKLYQAIKKSPEKMFHRDITLLRSMMDTLLNYEDEMIYRGKLLSNFWHKLHLAAFALERTN